MLLDSSITKEKQWNIRRPTTACSQPIASDRIMDSRTDRRLANCLRLQGQEGDQRIEGSSYLGVSDPWVHIIGTSLTAPSRVTRPHGNSGVVKSKFRVNLPARVFGASCRIVSHRTSSLQSIVLTVSPDALPIRHLNRLPAQRYDR
jgi:ribosomal protein L35AE/L33A